MRVKAKGKANHMLGYNIQRQEWTFFAGVFNSCEEGVGNQYVNLSRSTYLLFLNLSNTSQVLLQLMLFAQYYINLQMLFPRWYHCASSYHDNWAHWINQGNENTVKFHQKAAKWTLKFFLLFQRLTHFKDVFFFGKEVFPEHPPWTWTWKCGWKLQKKNW